MKENDRAPHELTLPQMVERYREAMRKGAALVEAMFREAVERKREEEQRQRARVEQVHRRTIEQARLQPLPPSEPPTVPYTQLPPAKPDSPLCQE